MTTRQIHSFLFVITFQNFVLLCLCGCSASSRALERVEPAHSESAVSESTLRPTSGNSVADRPIEKAAAQTIIQRWKPGVGDESIASDAGGSAEGTTGASDMPVPSETVKSHRKPENRKSIPDVDATAKTIDRLLEKARRAKERKDYGNAFRFASEAWEAACVYPNDSRIKKRADEISIELETLGQLANSRFSASAVSARTTLIDK